MAPRYLSAALSKSKAKPALSCIDGLNFSSFEGPGDWILNVNAVWCQLFKCFSLLMVHEEDS